MSAKLMTPRRYSKILKVLERRQAGLTVITDKVHKGRNIAAILRTCDAVGIDTIHLVAPASGFQRYRGTATGSEKWVATELYDDVQIPIQKARAEGFQIIAAHQSSAAIDYRDIDYTQSTALLLGAEKPGPSPYAIDSADQHISIPMVGMVASLNVSVACSIIMAEAQRQRTVAGLYGTDSLSSLTYKQRLFTWCQPESASFCDKYQLAYPELDDVGDIINAAEWYRAAQVSVDVVESLKLNEKF